MFYRVYSEGRIGKYLTAIPPRSRAFAQEALSLPRANAADFLQTVRVPVGTRLLRSRALPIRAADTIFPIRRGGAEQFELLTYIPRESFGPGVPFP